MDQPLKLFTQASERIAFETDKQTSSFEHGPENSSTPATIEINGSEGNRLKAPRHQKFRSFHEILGPVLAVGQFFGNLPVEGVLDRDVRNLSFKWSSLRTIYAVLYILIGGLEVCLMVWRGFVKGFDIMVAELIMFYFDSVAQSFLFLHLATKWRDIMSFWCKKEKPFLCEPYTTIPSCSESLSLRIKLLGGMFFIFFMTEHFMFIGMQLEFTQLQLNYCNVTDMPFLHNYMRRLRPHLLDALPYRWWIFPPFQLTITLMAFCWNYVDYFIVILSLGISTRFNQLNKRLRHTPTHQMDRKFWLEIRLHYTNLVDLLEYIDDQISLLVLFSMSHNLFLVCTKIFEAVKYSNRALLIDDIYFYFYLFFLIFRTLVVLYSCSSIHTASSYPLVAIRNTPSTMWSVNLKRLSDMIQTEDVSLSGNKFFFITRQMILAMIGTIVTFELVLLDRGNRTDDGPLCSYFVDRARSN